MVTQETDISNRYRDVKAGLDEAVRQAEQRNFHDMYIFDADVHANELFANLGKYVSDSRWKKVFLGDPEDEPLLKSALSNYGATRKKGSMLSTHDQFSNEVVIRSETSWPDPMPVDEVVEIFTRRIQDIGIKQSIVFPGPGMANTAQETNDPDFELELIRAYTQYMLDNYGDYKEILSPIFVPYFPKNIEKVAELIDDYGNEKGICGVLFYGINMMPMGSEDYNSIFEAAQKKGLPILLHGNNASRVASRDSFFQHYRKGFLFNHVVGFPLSLILNLTSMLVEGLPERFPNLKFVFIEGGVTWMMWFRQRLDDDFAKKKYEAPLLKKLPSEYMDEFYYATQPLESMHKNELEPFFKCIKNWEDHFLYSSDYPHWDFDAPSVVYDLPFLSKEAKKKIMGENARKLFRL